MNNWKPWNHVYREDYYMEMPVDPTQYVEVMMASGNFKSAFSPDWGDVGDDTIVAYRYAKE